MRRQTIQPAGGKRKRKRSILRPGIAIITLGTVIREVIVRKPLAQLYQDGTLGQIAPICEVCPAALSPPESAVQ
jgi:hypothetical protein